MEMGHNSMKTRIYMDNAATTALAGEVLERMLPYFSTLYGNPSSVHTEGRKARRAVENARREVAQAIGAEPGEIFFTSGGSESDNWALRGTLSPLSGTEKKHIIISVVEHHAVLHTVDALEKQGWQVTRLPVDAYGRIRMDDLRAALRPETALISIMAANNEVGTLQPVREIGLLAKEAGVLFHTDAVQAAGSLPVRVKDWNVDLLSLSGHKFHGPKGVGVLYVKRGVRIDPLIFGGAQEKAIRAGTENVPAIVGMGAALQLCELHREETAARLIKMRDRLISRLMEKVPDCRLNGHPTERLPGNVNVSFPGVEGESLLMRLDLAGISASAGSACTSGSLESSHVLRAMGLSEEEAKGSLRLSLSGDNTEEEIERVLEILPPIVAELRSLRQ